MHPLYGDMLRITIERSAGRAELVLEGKLAGAWTAEVERCWLDLDPNQHVSVNLAQVDHADLAGKYLLAAMHAHGVRLLAPGLAIADLVEEITSPRWARRAFVLLFALGVLASPSVAQDRSALRLTLKQAVELALSPEGNTRVQLASEAVRQAESRASQARSALLPDLDATVSHVNQTRNLEAMGIRVSIPIPGFRFPTFVGPFDTFDARATVRQNVFDLSSIRRYQSAKTAVGGVRKDRDHASDLVAAQVARTYLAALKTNADVDAARSNVELATALLELVQSQKTAGTGTGIDVVRARVQRANEQQRLVVARNQQRRARLELLRAIGMRLDTVLELEGALAYTPATVAGEAEAAKRALDSRSDFQAQREHERAARLASSATAWERLPSLGAFGDYGSIGTGINHALPTRTYGLSLRVPVFDGGRRDARRAESRSQYRSEQIRTHDLQEAIELEVRVALDALRSADEQVQVAAEGLKLAEQELTQARRRYAAGVTTGLEVTDAQTRLERARENHVSALYAHNVATIDLAQAQGTIEDILR